MNLITVIIISVFTITSAIRVPTSWPKKQNVQQTHKFRTGRPSEGSEIYFQPRPHVVHMQKHNKINSGRKYQQSVRHPNLKRPHAKKEFKPSATFDEWKPIYPAHMLQKDNSLYNNYKQLPFQSYKQVRPVKTSPLYRNYRDDKTHEPTYEERTEERHVHHEKPLSTHEVPPEIPTRPIYPGEGQWAKKGVKHRPFVSQHRFSKPEEEEEDQERPEGYETYEKNQQVFDKHRDRFRENINEFPQKHKLGAYKQEQEHDRREEENEEEEQEEDEEEEEEKQEFVPTKLYTQVRRSESDQHLPRLAEDPRLREVIKDSKIQTVYTEEGYEDLAYDHAGHEKNAEEDEGFSEFDEEIEKEKQRRAKERKVVEKEDDSEGAGSQQQSVRKPLRVKKGKLMKNEQVKTVSLKEQDNGDSELEVVSEVKILEVPNNGTKTQKYVRIFPKVYRYDKTMTEATTTAKKEATDVSAATEIPQLLATVSRINRSRRRFKRYTVDFPQLTADTDFIHRINHNLPPVPQKFEKPKYPYYNDPTLNPYSPLRYAEDLNNIPKKTEDTYAFYNQAEQMECPEIESDVDPIPERVKNADEDPENMEETTDVQELVQTPRLKGLGDKIDCLKVRYFGENPLDSPFFKEEELGPVIPLFKIFKKTRELEQLKNEKSNEVEEQSYSHNIPIHEEVKQPKRKPTKEVSETDLTILADVVSKFNRPQKSEATTVRSALKIEILEPSSDETVDSVQTQAGAPVISIITTPKYTINLKPKHIYHQIELLEYLPSISKSRDDEKQEEEDEEKEEEKEEKQPEKKEDNEVKEKEKQTDTTEPPSNDRIGKSLDEVTTTAATPIVESSPESQPLKHRRRQRPRKPPGYPYFQVFDINKYLPRNTYTLLNRLTRTSTAVPHGVGELHYKEEMKASEQLNVFADVINNIKNSSRDPQQIAASSNRVSFTVNAIDNHRKIPVVELASDTGEETNSFYVTTTTPAPRGTIKYSSYKTKEDLYEDMINRDKTKYENLELLKVKRLTTTEPYSSDTRISASNNEEQEEILEDDDDNEDATEKVLGLMPPGPNRYKTIFPPKIAKPYQETKVNLFYVLGMKPPSSKQKVYVYSDYKTHTQIKRNHGHLQRGKRSAQRPSYSEVVRNRNKPIDVDDVTEAVVPDDDDYVPHRPRNYHYDEKTGRIVYDNVQKETEAPEEEYIEITEAPLPKPTRRASATTAKYEISGPSYVDFIKALKSNANYTEIPDPPSTEKGEEITTTTTTAKPVSTDPPQFLSFLSKLKSDASYQEIPDKTTAKTTTTEATELGEAVEETQMENVQNSPGGQSSSQMLQIFDINDYLPKVKTYTPRTSIDYSKYKTIERASVPRHNLSSRYNSDDEDLESVKTSKVPVLMEEKRTESEDINPEMSESKHEDVEPSTTSTTTEAPSTTTSRRVRTRSKNRGTRRTTTVASVTTIPTEIPRISEEAIQVSQDKPKRVYPRRRPTRIKIDRTTETPDFEVDESISAKVIRRRHQRNEVPTNKSIQDRADANSDVEVLKKYDRGRKHGGNYRKENEDSESKASQIATSDEETVKVNKTQTEENQTTDDKAAEVQVFKKYDPTQRHGGNYRKENEESESKEYQVATPDKDVEVIKKYDPKKKHGGNYRRENEESESQEYQITSEEEGKENTTQSEESQTTDESDKAGDVQVFKKYDPSKKHGGNYRRENEESESKSYRIMTPNKEEIAKLNRTQTAEPGNTADVEVMKKYDSTKRRGGNYRKQQEETESKKTQNVRRLTDVIHKPSTYYTDPKLPAKVNQLMEGQVNEEEVEENVKNGDGEGEEVGYDYEESDEKATTTKRPFYVKDPNKRLYFYAPI